MRLFLIALLITPALFAAGIEGTFVVNGVDAGLKHIRAHREVLDDKGTKGVAVLLTERKAEGAIGDWRTADPQKAGSFVYAIFEPNGAIYIVELGHKNAESGRFGVLMEVQKVAYEVKGDTIKAHIRTPREESFGEDKFTVDLKFEGRIEK